MKRTSSPDDPIRIEVSQVEYDAIAAALGETLEALEDWEFQTRTGVEPEVMRRLLGDFRDADPDEASA